MSLQQATKDSQGVPVFPTQRPPAACIRSALNYDVNASISRTPVQLDKVLTTDRRHRSEMLPSKRKHPLAQQELFDAIDRLARKTIQDVEMDK